MATVLLIVIYLAFIGLGLPDSLFGTAWPAIYAEFVLPLSFGSVITIITTAGTTVSSVLSARLIARFGTGKVTAVSTALTAAALLGHVFTGDFLVLCLLSVPLGLGAGAIDAGLNNYVALHYSASQMSLLHCFYGVGVSISPYLLALVMDTSAGWRGGYEIAFYIQLAITLVLIFTLPLWKRVQKKDFTPEPKMKILSLSQLSKVPGVKTMWSLFLVSCAIEGLCSGWSSTFLVETRHITASKAAEISFFYYIGLTAGRLLSGLLATRLSCWKIIRIGLAVLGVALILLLLPVPATVLGVGLFLVGLGNAPMYPNFTFLAPINFGPEVSQSIIGTQLAAACVGIMVVPAVCGLLGQALGMWVFPVFLAVTGIVMMLATARIQSTMKKAGKDTR